MIDRQQSPVLSAEPSFRDWITFAPQFGPRHIWGNARTIVTCVLDGRTKFNPTWRHLIGYDSPQTKIDTVVHRGMVSSLRGRIVTGLLTVVVGGAYFVWAVGSTVVGGIGTQLLNLSHNPVEPKQKQQIKQLQGQVNAGLQAVAAGKSPLDVLRDRVTEIESAITTPQGQAEKDFRHAATPADGASRNARVSAAINQSETVRTDAARSFRPGLAGFGE